jgi:hypothetical protein
VEKAEALWANAGEFMQFRLSSIFLIFFVLATSLSLFSDKWIFGLWTAIILCLAGLCLNKIRNLNGGIGAFIAITLIGIALPWFKLSEDGKLAKRRPCANKLLVIGYALLSYETVNKHFPPAYTCDKDGKPLFSWLVELLPYMNYRNLYEELHKEEPWNSPHNAKVLAKVPDFYKCPGACRAGNDFSSSYMALAGKETLFHRDGQAKKLWEFTLGLSNTLFVLEITGSTRHWAEPFVLTSDEVLENTRVGKGPRIATCHPGVIPLLEGDGSVHPYPSKLPLSIWRGILVGEFPINPQIVDIENPSPYPEVDPNAPDLVDVYVEQSPFWANQVGKYLSVVVWIFAVGLLIHRAIRSRESTCVNKERQNMAVGGDGA